MIKTFFFGKNKDQTFIKTNLKTIKLSLVVLVFLLFPACLNTPEENTPSHKNVGASSKPIPKTTTKIYQNELFWEVSVEKIENNKYRVKGKGKNSISFLNYVVEDGHDQLLDSIATLNKDNPEWGTFNFTFEAKKKDENTTLVIALFEKRLKNPETDNKNSMLIIPLN